MDEIKKYNEYIRGLRDGSLSEEDIPEIDEIRNCLVDMDIIIERMDMVNKGISSHFSIYRRSIQNHLSSIMVKARSFEDRRYDRLFLDTNGWKTGKRRYGKKTINTDIIERLEGFITENIQLSWNNEEIDEVVSLIARNRPIDFSN